MPISKILSAALVLGAASLPMVQPVQAAPLLAGQSLGNAATNVQTVRYRHGFGGRHFGYGRRGYGYGGRGYGFGGGAAIGLATGALIGSAIANSQARASDAVGYCSQRFQSYDPASGTYLGYDGDRHPCP